MVKSKPTQFFLLFLLNIFTFISCTQGAAYSVYNGTQLKDALLLVNPGDIISIGYFEVWTEAIIGNFVIDRSGTEISPIILRGLNPTQIHFEGQNEPSDFVITLKANHWHIQNINFGSSIIEKALKIEDGDYNIIENITSSKISEVINLFGASSHNLILNSNFYENPSINSTAVITIGTIEGFWLIQINNSVIDCTFTSMTNASDCIGIRIMDRASRGQILNNQFLFNPTGIGKWLHWAIIDGYNYKIAKNIGVFTEKACFLIGKSVSGYVFDGNAMPSPPGDVCIRKDAHFNCNYGILDNNLCSGGPLTNLLYCKPPEIIPIICKPDTWNVINSTSVKETNENDGEGCTTVVTTTTTTVITTTRFKN